MDRSTEPHPLPDIPGLPIVEEAKTVVRALQSAGYEAFFVGGCVRNWLLGLPIADIDIATSATPEGVALLFGAAKSVGAHFGVMLVPHGDFVFEVATFRADGEYTDHRRPSEVRYGRFAEDFKRRDFTVNAMYYDPVAEKLIDPAGGREDLQRRVLRTVGEPRARFEEDALRLLRAVRFAVRYGLEIDAATAEAIREKAPTLVELSAERVGGELTRIMTGPEPGRAVRLMAELEIWRVIAPEIEAMRACPQPPEYHPEGDVFVHTAMVVDNVRAEGVGADKSELPIELALAALLHDIGKPPTIVFADRIRFPEHDKVGAVMAECVCERWKMPRRVCEEVTDLVAQHMNFINVPHMKASTLKRFVTQENFELHLALHRADCLGSHRKLDSYQLCLEERERLAQERPNDTLLPPPLVKGEDLIALGLKPGPRFKVLLDAARDEQLEGRLHAHEEALDWLRRNV